MNVASWNTVANSRFLLSHYPELRFVSERLITGKVKYSATKSGELIILNPKGQDAFLIEDEYEVEIHLPLYIENKLPELYLIGSRMPDFAKAKAIPLIDLHFFADFKACVCPLPVQWEAVIEGKASDLSFFLDELVVPFLYQQSYFQKFGEWPISNYSHGYLAFFEYFRRSTDKSKNNKEFILCKHALECYRNDFPELKLILSTPKNIAPHKKCFCGSDSKLKKCHKRKMTKEAYAGLILFCDQLSKGENAS